MIQTFKRTLLFLTFVAALLVAFCIVSKDLSLEFVQKYASQDWFIKLDELATEWGLTVLIIGGLSGIITTNGGLSQLITLIVYAVMVALVIMTKNFPDQLAQVFEKLHLK